MKNRFLFCPVEGILKDESEPYTHEIFVLEDKIVVINHHYITDKPIKAELALKVRLGEKGIEDFLEILLFDGYLDIDYK